MERVHQLVVTGAINDEGISFWRQHWPHIASAKVSLDTKVATYNVLRKRGQININRVCAEVLYEMIRADRAFIASLDLDTKTERRCAVCIIWIEDDAAALARYEQKPSDLDPLTERFEHLKDSIRLGLLQINAPRCMRFMFQDRSFRERILRTKLSPVAQRLAEELVQPTDVLYRQSLLIYGQSVKLIGMCVPDEELILAWLDLFREYPAVCHADLSAMLARKMYALATLDMLEALKDRVIRALNKRAISEGCFELAWLFGLLGPFDPAVQACFLRYNVSLFPAMTFAMIVAMCDGYLKATCSGVSESQRRFFDVMMRLPMDLQALLSLQLWGHASTVIPREKFDRAFLAII